MKRGQRNPALAYVYERLRVTDATQIEIDGKEVVTLEMKIYVARSEFYSTEIDRALAVQLRIDGAPWCGDILLDPCGVA